MWKIYTGTAPNDIKIQFHYNDRTGPQCIVPNLNAGSSSKQDQQIQLLYINRPQTVQHDSLPKELKECNFPDSFKKTLDDYIMSLPDSRHP